MSDVTGKHSPVEKFFRMCLFVFGGIVLLQLSLQMLAEIWPWLVGIAVLVGLVAGLLWWLWIRRQW
ncbi:hypothetical protein Csp1_19970 [Corynebacterium provencense]|uniref:Uncharacterized protein n=1 Tax=Corynebacterium provencense TaxID=1737425 RepID=A0A2Z3YNC4_9CORY|nr:hypothetical protein [Corynebacterium provencense]AWT26765.1 hypothetical protein Csp1_19970 [Corynebacterium provencense]